MEKQFDELITSYINGNRGYVVDEIMKFQKKRLIMFFFWLEENRDWIETEYFEISSLLHSLHNRVL